MTNHFNMLIYSMTKNEIKNLFKSKLSTSATWAVKGMLKIYEFQTASEQSAGVTHEHNKVGFSGCDAEILSSFCKQILKGYRMSDKQMVIVFKKMPRYWRQLSEISDQAKVESIAEKIAA